MADNNELRDIKEDIREIREWTHAHTEEHTADTRLLASALDSLRSHNDNHHGRRTTLTQGGIVGGGAAVLYGLLEILRRFAF